MNTPIEVPCARCGRGVAPLRERCLYCGGPRSSTPEPSEARPCPSCAETMFHHRIGVLTLDRCGRCQGTWYDRGELEERLKLRREHPIVPAVPRDPSATPRRSSGARPCPRCRQPMLRRRYGGPTGAFGDVCVPHGVFLEPGALEAIAQAGAPLTQTAAVASVAMLPDTTSDAWTELGVEVGIEVAVEVVFALLDG